MAFWKTASVEFKPLGDYTDFRKRANALHQIKGYNLIDSSHFEKMATLYYVSANPKDYYFLSCLAVRANVPNKNGDAISTEELFRFRPARKCRTYETFIHSPLHVNHFSSDPKLAKGFIVDAIYNDWAEDFAFVETVVAIDKTKDPILAEAVYNGRINKFSMGSIVEALQCSLSHCKKIAYREEDLCEHLKNYRMQKINGELCFEWNIGVDYEELSIVDNPAEEMAMTRAILGSYPVMKTLSNYLPPQKRAGINVYASVKNSPKWFEIMGIDRTDMEVVKRYFENLNYRVPPSVLRVIGRLFEEVGNG